MVKNYYNDTFAKYYDSFVYYDYRKILKSIIPLIEGKRNILEIGVGTGNVAVQIAKRGFVVHGLDNSASMLNIARKKARQNHVDIKFYLQSASNLKLKQRYDVVLSQGGVLAWVGTNLESYLRSKKSVQNLLLKIFNILRKGGLFLISIQAGRPKRRKIHFNKNTQYIGITKKKGRLLFVTHIIKRDKRLLMKEQFEKFILTPAQFKKLARETGFEVIGANRQGIHYILRKS